MLTKKENFQKLDINSIFFPWTKKFSLDVFGKYFGKSPSPNTDKDLAQGCQLAKIVDSILVGFNPTNHWFYATV